MAYSPDFPADPAATNRDFGPATINRYGQILFKAAWCLNGQNATIYVGRPGSIASVISTADPVPIDELKFTGGPGTSCVPPSGLHFHFFDESFNATGDVLFDAGVVVQNPIPARIALIDQGIWKVDASGGSPTLISWRPTQTKRLDPLAVFPPVDVANLPYAGNGRLQYTGGAALHLSDEFGYFIGGVEAFETGNLVEVVPGDGLFSTRLVGRRVISYAGADAPGLGGDYVFAGDGGTGFPLVAQRNGNFVVVKKVRLRIDPNPFNTIDVLYEYRDDVLAPIHVPGASLPDQPPPMEVFGTNDPYTVDVTGATIVDDVGNTLVEGRAWNAGRTESKLLGIWKKTADGLTLVLRIGHDYPVDGGTIQIVQEQRTGSAITYCGMNNGRMAFVADFTGLGDANVRQGLFREGANGFELLAQAGMPVPGATTVFGAFAGLNQETAVGRLKVGAAGEVAFMASEFDAGQGTSINAVWVCRADGGLGRVVGEGETMDVGGTERLLLAAAPFTLADRCFNDSGVLVFTARFTDNTAAIIRAVPPGYTDPVLPGRDFWFSGAKDNNWHTKGGNPPTNWNDLDGTPRSDPPGDAEPNIASVFVETGKSVVLDQKPAPVGSLRSDGFLTLKNLLTLNYPSEIGGLSVEDPAGGITVNNTSLLLDGVADWHRGTLTLQNSTLRIDGILTTTTGEIVSTGGTSGVDNFGLIVLDGNNDFDIHVPVRTRASPDEVGVVGVEGRLRFLDGGSFAGKKGVRLDYNSQLVLAGDFDLSGEIEFVWRDAPDFAGDLDLGDFNRDLNLALTNGATLRFDLPRNLLLPVGGTYFHRGEIRGAQAEVVNGGYFQWEGGTIAIGPGTIAAPREFANYGTMLINQFTAPLLLEGVFINEAVAPPAAPGVVTHQSALALSGLVDNRATWNVRDGASMAPGPGGRGEFVNRGDFTVRLVHEGTIDIDAEFQNAPERALPSPVFDASLGGLVQIGDEAQGGSLNPQTTVNLKGPVHNLADGVLRGGVWLVQRHCTLTFPGSIRDIQKDTALLLDGGSVTPLDPNFNEGLFWISDRNVNGSESLVNIGELRMTGTARLTIADQVVNVRGVLECGSNAELWVGTTFTNKPTARLIMEGRISCLDASIEGLVTGGSHIVIRGGDNSILRYSPLATIVPGLSPGTMTITGSADLNGATLVMEVAGTAPGQYDVLAISGNVALGGTLVVPLLNGFVPAPGDVFPIVQAGSITGGFSTAISGARVSASDGSGSFQLFYGAGSPHAVNQVVLANWLTAPTGSPVITSQPVAQSVGAGGSLTLSVTAAGMAPLSYQWRYHGTDIPGATGATYTVSSAQGFHSGAYSVTVNNALGTVQSSIAAVTIANAPVTDSRLLNLSTRGLTQTGDNILIPGFVVSGSASSPQAGTKKLLIRAVGPTLSHPPFNIATALDNPRMTLKRLDFSVNPPVYIDVKSNDDWMTNPNAADIDQAIQDLFAFDFQDDREAALLVDLAPGQYTVFADGVANATGVAIVELYDADAPNPAATLINISNRGFVGTGDNVMIPGFVVSSEGSKTLLIRVVGPTLGGAPFNVPGTMADPKLEIFPAGSGTPILTQDNWGDSPDAATTAQVASSLGAFALANGSADAAFVVTLQPGTYSVVGSSADGVSTGVVLVEIYVIP